jgi:hypothetical protein
MKEHPIIFSTDMVKAILEGRKTMTRRVIKPCSTATLHDGSQPEWVYTLAKCPYGQVGDRLWVRETWRPMSHDVLGKKADVFYFADNKILSKVCSREEWERACYYHGFADARPRPSIHMFRWASRITLEITELRVERLQEIGGDGGFGKLDECRAEGLIVGKGFVKGGTNLPMRYNSIHAFIDLWDTLNAKRGYGWDTNPWVWGIGFKVVTPELLEERN